MLQGGAVADHPLHRDDIVYGRLRYIDKPAAFTALARGSAGWRNASMKHHPLLL
ncbi:MAG: hypothetical protein HND48_24485 [Chloroflexi bacterium]|nr:hypothetical protein [Chloroflexota bacterium]